MLNKDYKEMLQFLLEEGVQFLLVGAYAMAAHGVPRATGDIDLWVRPNAENAERVFRALVRFGAPLEGIQPREFADPGQVFQIGAAPRRIDILTSIDGMCFEDAANDHITVMIDDLEIPVLSRTALIANKRASARPKDLLDVQILEPEARTGTPVDLPPGT